MLTQGHSNAERTLRLLRGKGVRVRAILHERSNILPAKMWGSSRLLRHLRQWLRQARSSRKVEALYTGLADEFVWTGPLNSKRMERDVKALSPDFILLDGIGILSHTILSCAKFGVINSHPGLLPWLRNVGVVGNAFLRDVPVGVTCHYVNEGIDKGDIIERRLLPIVGNEATLDEIEIKANEFASELMADVVAKIVAEGKIPASIKQAQHFPPCHWLTSDQRMQVDKEIASGKAKKLYESWRVKIPHSSDGSLPVDFEAP